MRTFTSISRPSPSTVSGIPGLWRLSRKQLIDRVDQPGNVDVHHMPQDAMIDQIVAVSEVISCACKIFPGNIVATLRERDSRVTKAHKSS